MSLSFEALYRAHHADVLRFALYLCGSHSDAEDIAAETFVRAWASDAPSKARTMRAYLFAIARNLYLRRHQQKRREGPMPEELRADTPTVAAEVEARQELHSTLARLSQLDEIDRSALLMRAFHGLSYDEIGSALGISAGTARVKVHRARQFLMDKTLMDGEPSIMTSIDREVIRDLLPLYRSGLASAATRKLVETHLATDPELAGQLDVPDEPASHAQATEEFRAFARSRSLLRWQRRLFGLAIGLTVLSLTTAMRIDEHGVSNVRLLAVEQPLAFAPVMVGAVIAWIGYFVFKRRVRSG